MRLGNANVPVLPVWSVRVSLVPRLVNLTVAPETMAPLESETVPRMPPNLTWATSCTPKRLTTRQTQIAVTLEKPLGFLRSLISLTGSVTELRGGFENRATTAAKTLRIVSLLRLGKTTQFVLWIA